MQKKKKNNAQLEKPVKKNFKIFIEDSTQPSKGVSPWTTKSPVSMRVFLLSQINYGF